MTAPLALLHLKARIQNRQNLRLAKQTVATHYDLPVEIFEATFDARLTGSCAYWKDTTTLDDAQTAKLDLVCRKIGLTRGARILDIGCGWGAFMGYAAQQYGAECVGVTISPVQVEYARKRYAGLSVDPRLMDYRRFDGPKADHVVSMGMFEHVGSKNHRTFFKRARSYMKDDGLLLLHTISFPEECRHVIETLAKVYKHDARTKGMSPNERLAYHEARSGPLMEGLRGWMNAQFKEKKVEPNSGLGKAFSYMLNHWNPDAVLAGPRGTNRQ